MKKLKTKESDNKLIIVSNRLPVTISYRKGKIDVKPSPGGLASGLRSLAGRYESIWVGWPGMFDIKGPVRTSIIRLLREKNMFPLFLTKSEYKWYYEGFSNKAIWPLFHYFIEHAEYNKKSWEYYKKVNDRFLDTVLEIYTEGSIIWIQDYHLMLLPGLLRQKIPDASIGFFLHIPFPSYEIFRLLPWREEILQGLIGADLIGFHTYDYLRHFLSSIKHILGVEHFFNELLVINRVIKADTFPLGIDVDRFNESSNDIFIKQKVGSLRNRYGDKKVILSVDRLDYTKGIVQKVLAFERFLDKYPEYRGKVTLLMIVVPSRWKVEYYGKLKDELDRHVSRINSKYRSIDWLPIEYFYRSFRQEELIAFYKISDVAIVTPFRDGMNLVSKEFISTKYPDAGVLVLSEMAGSAIELSEAIIVNPNNMDELVSAIKKSMEMPISEARDRVSLMFNKLKRYDVYRWVEDFLDSLKRVKAEQEEAVSDVISETVFTKIKEMYDNANRRLFFLDYDGTLIPFFRRVKEARPDSELIRVLKDLSRENEVVLISGRDRETMDEWFSDIGVNLTGEHGAWFKKKSGSWYKLEDVDNSWKDEIRSVMEYYVDKTPGSSIEEKEFSLVWHYRGVNSDLGYIRARDLVENLSYMIAGTNLQVLEGNKVVEIKNSEIGKGRAVREWLKEIDSDFILAIGDDWTDEDMFRSLSDDGITIKVGFGSTSAKFRLRDYKEVREFIIKLMSDQGE
ncbi:MAG: bifunctional alpha,alpha-trehalose-phosphate synthase (UDP-forming)/trehalose-phosphatase [Candidatus Marinimicrobia bacterium]|nr:bifunctional alpha,alpha-trehalose-phosphate synthase (UDP-forming)/trehalose-phosphatase [Candidatus Neomarinimicrobiota bacterium]